MGCCLSLYLTWSAGSGPLTVPPVSLFCVDLASGEIHWGQSPGGSLSGTHGGPGRVCGCVWDGEMGRGLGLSPASMCPAACLLRDLWADGSGGRSPGTWVLGNGREGLRLLSDGKTDPTARRTEE